MPQSCLLLVEKRQAEVSHGTDSNGWVFDMGWHQKKGSFANCFYLAVSSGILIFTLDNLENMVYSALQGINYFPGNSGHLCLSLKLSDILVYFIC